MSKLTAQGKRKAYNSHQGDLMRNQPPTNSNLEADEIGGSTARWQLTVESEQRASYPSK